ncbi:MAG TPA: hypothetical protein VGR38_07600, partial [Candidatus Polarisedimenticolia bacterium]|nr:hypothetical protein [Candidatus Polarisedimenticolia bacterium]
MRRLLCGLFLAGLAFPATADLRRETEPNQPAVSAQPVVLPVSVGGAIQASGDTDYYAVRLEAGQTIQADVLARGFRADQNPGSQLTAVLELWDTDGTTALSRDDSQ